MLKQSAVIVMRNSPSGGNLRTPLLQACKEMPPKVHLAQLVRPICSHKISCPTIQLWTHPVHLLRTCCLVRRLLPSRKLMSMILRQPLMARSNLHIPKLRRKEKSVPWLRRHLLQQPPPRLAPTQLLHPGLGVLPLRHSVRHGDRDPANPTRRSRLQDLQIPKFPHNRPQREMPLAMSIRMVPQTPKLQWGNFPALRSPKAKLLARYLLHRPILTIGLRLPLVLQSLLLMWANMRKINRQRAERATTLRMMEVQNRPSQQVPPGMIPCLLERDLSLVLRLTSSVWESTITNLEEAVSVVWSSQGWNYKASRSTWAGIPFSFMIFQVFFSILPFSEVPHSSSPLVCSSHLLHFPLSWLSDFSFFPLKGCG